MLRFLPIPLLVIVGLATAKPGPDTAIKLVKAAPYFDVKVTDGDCECPPSFDLMLSKIFPSTGWSVVIDEVKQKEAGHIVIKVTIAGPKGAAGAAMTNVETRAKLGVLSRGPLMVEIRARSRGGDYKRVQAFVLNGKASRDR